MGPPFPDWIYDPRGYLAAKAREIWEKDEPVFLKEMQRQEQEKRARAAAQQEAEDRAAQEREYEEHPERHVDRAIRTLGISFKIGGGIKRSGEFLGDLLVSLSRQMKDAFTGEVERLKGRIPALIDGVRERQGVERFLEEFLGEWKAQNGFTDG
jgi:hypothetical protein